MPAACWSTREKVTLARIDEYTEKDVRQDGKTEQDSVLL